MEYHPGDITIVGHRARLANVVKPVLFDVTFSDNAYHAIVVETKKGRTLGIDATTPKDCFPDRLFVDDDYDAPYSRGFVCDAVRIAKNGSTTFYIMIEGRLEVLGSYALGTEFAVHSVIGRVDPDTGMLDPDTAETVTLTPKNNKEDE